MKTEHHPTTPKNHDEDGSTAQITFNPSKSMTCVSRETIKCSDCRRAEPELESDGKVIWCGWMHQLRHASTLRMCASYSTKS